MAYAAQILPSRQLRPAWDRDWTKGDEGRELAASPGLRFARPPDPSGVASELGISWRLQSGGTSLVGSLEEDLKRIEELYSLRAPGRVVGFLREYPELASVLIEAYPQLEAYFGPYPQAALEVVTDPEADDVEELFVYIRTNLDPGTAIAKLDELDEAWFLDQLQRTGGRLNFNLEFL